MESRPKILMYEQMHSKGTELLAEKCDLIYVIGLKPIANLFVKGVVVKLVLFFLVISNSTFLMIYLFLN